MALPKFLTRLASMDRAVESEWALWLRERLRRHGLFERDEVDLSGRFCVMPFEMAEVNRNGDVYLCCESWLPRPAGNMHRDAPAKIWNSRAARQIRQSIHDGDFRYCDTSICPKIADGLPTKAEISEKDPRKIREFGRSSRSSRSSWSTPPGSVSSMTSRAICRAPAAARA